MVEWTQEDAPEAFKSALLDDLNTPLAIMHWQKMCKQLLGQEVIEEQEIKAFSAMNFFLGLCNQDAKSWFHASTDSQRVSPQQIEKLIAARQQARLEKDYKRADEIRQELQDQGVWIEDSGTETTWRYE